MGEIFMCLFTSVTQHGSVPCRVRHIKILIFAEQANFHILLQIGLTVVRHIPLEYLILLPY